MSNPIGVLYSDFIKLKEYLLQNKQLDFIFKLESDFKKTLLISSASYIESIFQEMLIAYFERNSTKLISIFLQNKAISRQYHTLFNWKEQNINSFLGLFGEEFKNTVNTKMKLEQNQTIKLCCKSFLELGRLRNELVHQNFLLYSTDKTAEEIIILFTNALTVVNFIKENLEQFNNYNIEYNI